MSELQQARSDAIREFDAFLAVFPEVVTADKTPMVCGFGQAAPRPEEAKVARCMAFGAGYTPEEAAKSFCADLAHFSDLAKRADMAMVKLSPEVRKDVETGAYYALARFSLAIHGMTDEEAAEWQT